jgi:hypothetical protein
VIVKGEVFIWFTNDEKFRSGSDERPYNGFKSSAEQELFKASLALETIPDFCV